MQDSRTLSKEETYKKNKKGVDTTESSTNDDSGSDTQRKPRSRVSDGSSKFRLRKNRSKWASVSRDRKNQGSGVQYVSHQYAPKMEKFNEESGQDFVKFIQKFEKYCKISVSGDEEFWLGVLGEHLEGRILEHFKLITNQCNNYNEVVDVLIEWYQENSELRIRTLKKKFKDMRPTSGESLYMFSLRLMSAFRAYNPKHSDPNRSKTLMKRFRKAIPRKARKALDSKVVIHRLRGYKPDWAFYQECVKLADMYEVSSEETDSSDGSPRTVTVHLGQSNGGAFHARQRQGGKYLSKRHDRGRNCFTCGGSNHFSADCWWNLGLCVSCGGDDHFIASCPNRDGNQQMYRGAPTAVRSGEYGSGEKNYERQSYMPSRGKRVAMRFRGGRLFNNRGGRGYYQGGGKYVRGDKVVNEGEFRATAISGQATRGGLTGANRAPVFQRNVYRENRNGQSHATLRHDAQEFCPERSTAQGLVRNTLEQEPLN